MPSPSEKVIKPETFRNIVLWANETKIELFNHSHNHAKFEGGGNVKHLKKRPVE